MDDKIAKYQEIERRGLLGRLSPEKQQIWAEYKSRHPEIMPQSTNTPIAELAVDDVRSERLQPTFKEKAVENSLGFLSNFDKGATFGFGRKLGGVLNAIGSYPVDRVAEAMGVENTPSFSDRYHEIVDTAVDSADKFSEQNPKTALASEFGGAILNPLNKVGAGFIGKGSGLLSKIERSAGVGGLTGAIAGVGETEDANKLGDNVASGTLFGGVLGGAIPVAEKTLKPLGEFAKSLMPNKFIASDLVKNKATGLKNVVQDNDSMRVLERGIGADDSVAESVLNKSTAIKDQINDEMSKILDKTTGRKLNIDLSNANQKQRYDDFISKNADVGVLDFSSAKKQLNKETINNSNVNKNLPRLENFTQGLNEFQTESLAEAINKGAKMSTNAKGTLGATHRAQEVLNDMIEKSYNTDQIGKKIATTETTQLQQLKGRLNQILEPSGIKPYDASLSKAKKLQDSFEKGFNFKPSDVKFENMGIGTERDKRAFLQGRIAKILDNVNEYGNVATAIKKDQNTLEKLMGKKQFNELMSKANKLETQFKRVDKLEKLANTKLVRPEAYGRPLEEMGDAGKYGAVLRLLDVAKKDALGDANKRASQYLLGDNVGINPTRYENAYNKLRGFLNNRNINSASQLTPYIVDILGQ